MNLDLQKREIEKNPQIIGPEHRAAGYRQAEEEMAETLFIKTI